MRKAEEDVYHTLHTMLWHLACDIGRSPPEKAPGLVAKALSDIMGVTGQTRLAADKCPSEWTKNDIEKHNVKCALASLEEAIKQRGRLNDQYVAAIIQRDNLSAELASTKELLANRNADVGHARKERDDVRRELEVAYRDRNAYHVALDKVFKLAGEIRRVADEFSTK